MSSQDFEKTLREWLRQGEASEAGPDPRRLWREGRRRRTRRMLMGGAAGLGLAAAAAAGVLAIGGGLLPEATDTGPANPTVTAPAPTVEDDTEQEQPALPSTPERAEADAPTSAEEAERTAGGGEDDGDADQDQEGPQDWGEPLAECSTGAYSPEPLDTEGLPAQVAETVTALVRDAMRCDEQALIQRAQQDDTSLSFGGTPAAEALAIPQEDPRYLKLAVMLTATSWARTDEGGQVLYVWPAAHAPESTEEDWQEVVDSGLHSEQEMALMPGPGEAYFGWRVGVSESGEWRFLIAGD